MSATAAKGGLSRESISQGGNFPDPFSIFILAIPCRYAWMYPCLILIHPSLQSQIGTFVPNCLEFGEIFASYEPISHKPHLTLLFFLNIKVKECVAPNLSLRFYQSPDRKLLVYISRRSLTFTPEASISNSGG
jgi:hypothetical protein